MSDKTPDHQDGNPHSPTDNKPKIPKSDGQEMRKMIMASQFAYTLVGATLILGYFGHWLGGFLGGPWNVLFMLLFGALGFGAEMYRMLKMVSPKQDDKSKDAGTKGDQTKDDTKNS